MVVDPKILSLKEYIKLVEIKLNSSDFKIVCLQEKGMEERRGFLGDHFHIKINVQKPLSSNHETKTESIYFFIKSLPINERARKLVEELGCFQKERFFYEVLSKDFCEFLKSNETDCFKLYPSCLMVKEDMFILDNLREDGFIPVESIQSTVDIPHCEQVLSGLAKFHSASILKEHFSKKSLKQLYPEILYENIYVDKGMWAKWMDAGVRTLQDLVPHLPRYKNDPMLLQKIEKKFQQLKHVMIELLKPTTTARSVICHGDSWISNFLFKYENNKPQEVALIDFQSMRYGPPAMDVQLFLYLSLPHDEGKSKQMSILEDFYYDCLKKELATKNLDVDSILPQTEFKETCETYALLGAFSICMYYQMMMVDNSFIDKVMTNRDMYDKYVLTSRSEEITGFFETDERFRKAMNGGMELLIELLLGN